MPTIPFSPMMRRRPGSSCLRLALPRSDPLAFLGAAYRMSAQAYVLVGLEGRRWILRAWPKRGQSLRALGASAAGLYADEVLRWRLLRLARRRRKALLLRRGASPAAGPAAGPGLAAERREEIARLLAEAEACPRDPLGIATPWEELRRP